MRLSPVYVGVVTCAGASVLWAAAWGLPAQAIGIPWLVLSVLAWLSAPLALRVPGAQLTITVSEALSFMVAFAIGWQPAAFTVAIDGLLTSLRQRNRRIDRTLFNTAEPALSMAACGLVLDWLSGMPPGERMNATLVQLIVPGFAATSTYLLLNSTLMTAAVALDTGGRPLALWRRYVSWLVLDHMGATSLALLVIAGARGSDFFGVLAALPLLGTLYVAYRRSIGRADEALRYAERLNSLYLGTVESLATAIDAKDQVTHGHITRVRRLALRLADRLGLREEAVLKGLEAGALLHDVGKLGVPDHILNKPGPLTAGEYEQVKRHTIVGADIVSRVEYPYPVAPIVRHHHENWDGTGYPDGLAGERIPVAARILSVIDCYDALTSDRPYRRAMSHEDALAIVLARRGSMYDPAVVDAFVALPADESCAPTAARAGSGAGLSVVTSRSDAPAGPLTTPAVTSPSPNEAPPISAEHEAVLSGLGRQLLQLTPASTAALFVPCDSGLGLRLAWTEGRAAADLARLQPVMGRGLSGWVAAHRTTLLNARGDLEFHGTTLPQAMPNYALSTPVELDGHDGVGVLTLYSDDRAFTPADQDLAQALARAIGPAVRRSCQCSVSPSPAVQVPRDDGDREDDDTRLGKERLAS